MQWLSVPTSTDDVLVRRFALQRGARTIPGVFWRPRQLAGPRPLVLLGHGGSAHAQAASVASLAARLVREASFVCASIDGPVHGQRRSDPHADGSVVLEDFRAFWAQGDGGRDDMAADWSAVVDALCKHEDVDGSAIGYHGLSMGTAYGLPLCAREGRIRAAVLGSWSADYRCSEALPDAAARISAEVLFILKWHDEIMSREGQLRLFDAVPGRNKQLNIYPAGHAETGVAQVEDTVRFLASRLGARVAAAGAGCASSAPG